MGNITIASLESGDILYRYSSIGTLDAAFVDETSIILGRSAAAAPFLLVDTETGETVPLAYPSDIGARIYRGGDTTLYAAAVNQSSGETTTGVILLSIQETASSPRLLEYQGEDTAFGLAECQGALATTLGGDGASLFNSRGFRPFERGAGLPEKLIDGRLFFIAIDDDGSLIWYDCENGSILAELRIYRDEWILKLRTPNEAGETLLWGTVSGPR
jgi:hypothetical protein